jgi:hypothetical protein
MCEGDGRSHSDGGTNRNGTVAPFLRLFRFLPRRSFVRSRGRGRKSKLARRARSERSVVYVSEGRRVVIGYFPCGYYSERLIRVGARHEASFSLFDSAVNDCLPWE